jgi:glucan 1,3-beta-glucosidase
MKTKTLKGVNLGGWLLLERWMTPTLFEGLEAKDEWQFMLTEGAEEKITHHRETFITEADFIWLHDNHIEAIRIPVGYWVLKNDGPYIQAKRHLDWAMEMAEKYSLKVLLDVHGLPGSQNGFDHSGKAGFPAWYYKKAYRQQSLEAIVEIAKEYAAHPQLWGFQVINEPFPHPHMWTLQRYYKHATAKLVNILRKETYIVFSDAFMPRLLSGTLRKFDHPVIMDVHLYHMTTLLAKYRSLDWFFKKTRRRQQLLHNLSQKQPLIIGEWSGVLRGDVIGSLSDDVQDRLFREYVALQQNIFTETAGWFYWNYKTEAPGVWNFRSKVEDGSIIL